jgi:STE24 endopeptidase
MATDEELRRYGFDPARQAVARRHGRARRLSGAAASLSQAAALLLFARFGALPLREALAAGLSGLGLSALFALVLSLGLSLVAFPGETLAHRVERRYGLSCQAFPSFLADAAKEAILSTAMGTAGLVGITAAIEALPYPWLVGWAGASFVIVLVGFAAPVLIAPLFYRFTPLRDPALSERLRALAAKAGVRVVGTFEMGASAKTTKATGYLSGIGRTRRIVLSDTMLRSFPADEVEAVIAHELGHHARRHLAVKLALISGEFLAAAAASWAALPPLARSFRLGTGIESAPLLVLLLGGSLALLSPLGNALSRRMEREADRLAGSLSGKPEALARVLVRISETNLRLAAPHPLIEFLTYDHPPPLRRVRQALEDDGRAGN